MPSDTARFRHAAADGGRPDGLSFRLIRREALADLEQGDIRQAAIGIALRREQQTRKKAGAHVGEIGRDRVRKPKRPVASAEQDRLIMGDERPGHRLDEAARGERALCETRAPLQQREDGFRDTAERRQRNRLDAVEPCNADHLLDEIRLPLDIRPP
jgi:hypothetical protein